MCKVRIILCFVLDAISQPMQYDNQRLLAQHTLRKTPLFLCFSVVHTQVAETANWST